MHFRTVLVDWTLWSKNKMQVDKDGDKYDLYSSSPNAFIWLPISHSLLFSWQCVWDQKSTDTFIFGDNSPCKVTWNPPWDSEVWRKAKSATIATRLLSMWIERRSARQRLLHAGFAIFWSFYQQVSIWIWRSQYLSFSFSLLTP